MNGNDRIFIGLLVAGLLLIYFLPEHCINSGNTLCIHYRITGLECPFCGFTRAIYSTLHFNILEAIHYNFAIIPLALLLLNDLRRRFTRRTFFSLANNYLLIATVVALMVLYILRISEGIS